MGSGRVWVDILDEGDKRPACPCRRFHCRALSNCLHPLPSSQSQTPIDCIHHVIVCEQVIFEVDGNTVRRVNLPRPLKPMQLQLAV